MNKVIIDFEFTGINNKYFRKNEMLQTKLLVADEKWKTISTHIWTHKTSIESSPGAFMVHRITPDMQVDHMFSADFFNNEVLPIIDNTELYSFSPSLDKDILLSMYELQMPKVRDLQEHARLCDEYEATMANHSSSMEAVHYQVVGSICDIKDHGCIEELECSRAIAEVLSTKKLNKYLKFVPWGPYAGMPIDEFIKVNKKFANGYRFNNNDLYSRSLDDAISKADEDKWK